MTKRTHPKQQAVVVGNSSPDGKNADAYFWKVKILGATRGPEFVELRSHQFVGYSSNLCKPAVGMQGTVQYVEVGWSGVYQFEEAI